MTTVQAIVQRLTLLSEDARREVLDFVEFIEARKGGQTERQDDATWSSLSLASAHARHGGRRVAVQPERPEGIVSMIHDGQVVLFAFPQTDQEVGKL